ncbi:MAG: hypothetical protein VKO21_07835 [Candidatus Sericytochromatia bacterium]|nr:hypothetical protein [Candidatus Sericytochromatia bacterium]
MGCRLSFVVASLATGLLLGGCGLQDVLAISNQLPRDASGSIEPLKLLPSFPVAFSVQLGDTKATFGDLVYQKSLATGPEAAKWSTDSQDVPTYATEIATFGPVALGEALKQDFAIPLALDLPAAPLDLPDLDTKVPAPSPIRLADTGVGSITVPGSGLLTAGPDLALADAISVPALAALTLPALPFGPSPETNVPVDLPPEIVRIRLQAGSGLAIPVENRTITASTVRLVLRDKTGTLEQVSQALAPNAEATISLSLAGDLVPPVSLGVSVTGEIPAGTAVGTVDLQNGQFAVGTTTVTLRPEEIDVNLPAMGPSAAGSTRFPTPDALKSPIRKTIDVASQMPADAGIQSLEAVELASGSMSLTMANDLDADLNVDLSFEGLEGLTGATATVDRGDVPPFTVLSGGGLRLGINARQTVTWRLDLSGSTMRPRAMTDEQGQEIRGIAVSASVNLLATQSDRSHLQGVTRIPATLRASQEASGRVTLSPLGISALQAVIDRTEGAGGGSPVPVPADFLDYGILPGRFALKVRLDNASGLAGSFLPGIEASLSASASVAGCQALFGGTGCPSTASVTVLGAGAESFDGTFLAGSAAATRSTTLELNERNSNLLDLIALGLTELRLSPRLRVGEGRSVRLTREDQMGGAISFELPLALRFEDFGPARAKKGPPASTSPLDVAAGLGPAEVERLRKHLRRVALELRIDNGWGLPLDLQLDFLKADESVGFTRTLRLGTPDGSTALSMLDLGPEEIPVLPDIRQLRIQALSSGSNGAVLAIRNTAELRLRVTAHLGVLFSPTLLQTEGATP